MCTGSIFLEIKRPPLYFMKVECSLFLLLIYSCVAMISTGCSTEEVADVNVFHYNQHNNITSLDPAFAKSQNNIWAVNHIYSTLVDLDENLSVMPGIAKSWQVDDDGTGYTFLLRDDVYFHVDSCFGNLKTRRVNAHDIVYSYNRLMDTVLNAPGSWIFAGKVSSDTPFKALNDSIFQLQLSQPFAPLLSLLTMQYCSILPSEAVDYYGIDFFKQPVGTGPFKFKRWIQNQGLFLLRNNEYFNWKDSTYYSNLDGIRTSFIGERSLAFLELVNDGIDFFTGLESSYINTALNADGTLREKYKDRVQLIKSPYLNFEYLGLNSSATGAHPLLSNVDFRKALNYGIDRQLMLQSLRNGIGKPADAGVITRGLPSYDPTRVKGYYYDKDKALSLLNQFPKEILNSELLVQTSKDYLDLTTFIAKQWEELGLNIRINVMESAALRSGMRSGDVSVFRASWIADYPDGESFLSMFYSGNPAPPNYTRFANEKFDQLYHLAMQETAKENKIILYQRMDSIVVAQAPVIFLFYDEVSIFADPQVTGLSRNALNLLQVKSIVKN